MAKPQQPLRLRAAMVAAVAVVLLPMQAVAFMPQTTSAARWTTSSTARWAEKKAADAEQVQEIELGSAGASEIMLTSEPAGVLPPPITQKPQLITFDATGTLIQLAEPVGMHYRQVLMKHTGIRLPRPDIFTDAFKEVYDAKCQASPCFGCSDSISAQDWWASVVRDTYTKVGVPSDIIDPLFPLLFDELYHEVFTGTDGWELNADTMMVLDKLKEWQETGDGPRLGVISNFDERLPKLLEALGIADYFDIIITSKECGMEKPCRQIFDIALTRLGIYERDAAVHVGNDYDTDVKGATAAGWNALYVKEPAYTNLPAQTTDTPFTVVGDLGKVLDVFGLEDPEQVIITTIHRTGNEHA
eukprot:CAMPEP_0182579988 /NCGR_PEP_ID=MMETSP1324-20130603/45670_1 /TAXON_ID=236786 /ORGANISM="Florenciella sp., Strain RCC1587" /LENGTH=357 /DNA_ID=CAMNT_0024796155 /DNA_START=270 /DNA_END=1340 /DNA_ORIENTATION=-